MKLPNKEQFCNKIWRNISKIAKNYNFEEIMKSYETLLHFGREACRIRTKQRGRIGHWRQGRPLWTAAPAQREPFLCEPVQTNIVDEKEGMLMRKFNKKGFTLAELLIVVAIIAVLVAVSIPVFTTQLEKSREETDIANLRSAYAIAQTDAMTENYNPSSGTYTKQPGTGSSAQYIAYYDIKQGELSSSSTGSKGKGSSTSGNCETLTGHMIYSPSTSGNTSYLTVVITETNGVASDVTVGFTDQSSISAAINTANWQS